MYGRVCALDVCVVCFLCVCFFQAEDGIRDLVRSRGLGDVYKRQMVSRSQPASARICPVLRKLAPMTSVAMPKCL